MADEVKGVDGAGVAPTSEDKGQEELTPNEEFLLGFVDKLATERENYKQGLLKAKGKSSGEDDGLSDEERLRKIVQEELAASNQAKESAEAKEALKTVLKENKELKVALRNRAQGNIQIAGGGGDKAQPAGDIGLSPEQIANLKARNPKLWTDDKIKSLAPKLKK